ncbi:unnamed protein product [Polarella glacialis]|uniref:Uncharacterized protein n=1 Tax=Polarella glacialis TaxID=89957 RepID=A0A813FM24_POLGL|nr:unnamed protein product [Polarella glacialis]
MNGWCSSAEAQPPQRRSTVRASLSYSSACPGDGKQHETSPNPAIKALLEPIRLRPYHAQPFLRGGCRQVDELLIKVLDIATLAAAGYSHSYACLYIVSLGVSL